IVRPDRQPVVACVDRGMIRPEGRSRRGPHMSATPDSTLADPERLIADLQRQLAECKAERDAALAERLKAQRRLAEATAERDEALEQQTATAEVLGVINSSPGNLTPVFEAMLEKALSLCDVGCGCLRTYDGKLFHPVADRGNAQFSEIALGWEPFEPLPGSPPARIASGEAVVQIADLVANAAREPGN